MRIGAINADTWPDSAAYYDVREFPTVLIFGLDKKNPAWYTRPYDIPGLSDIISAELTNMVFTRLDKAAKPPTKKEKHRVKTLTDTTFESEVLESEDMWIVEFKTSWCGAMCKALEAQWPDVLRKVKGDVKIGIVDVEKYEEIGTRYSIKEYPTVLLFPPKDKSAYEEYTDERNAERIGDLAMAKLKEYTFDPQIPHLVSEKQLQEICNKKKMICLIAFVSQPEDISFLTPVILESSAKRVQFLYSVLGDHPEL